MFLDKYREIVHTSTLNIPERLKAIDKDYFLVRNHLTSQFEVHHKGQVGGTLALILPFDELDNRTLIYVKETSIENAKKIFQEMEEKNLKIEEEKYKKMADMGKCIGKEIFDYVNNHESKDTIPQDSKMLKGVI